MCLPSPHSPTRFPLPALRQRSPPTEVPAANALGEAPVAPGVAASPHGGARRAPVASLLKAECIGDAAQLPLRGRPSAKARAAAPSALWSGREILAFDQLNQTTILPLQVQLDCA